MWIFGYGSLIWKVNFAYEESEVGYIRGYVRRFWQGSEDHRGTPEQPGRVVTLIPHEKYLTYPDEHRASTDDIVWGRCYRIALDDIDEVMKYLNYREKNGYTVDYVDFHPRSQPNKIIHRALVYIANEDNEAYLGYESTKSIADHILRSSGPSGPNIEYLLELYQALCDLVPDHRDDHLHDLVEAARKFMETRTEERYVILYRKYFQKTVSL
jgi:glutathione-specific gamma-glutamylcyclotransferase